MRNFNHNTTITTRAFTLIEILIVVVILGILAAIVIVQFVGAREDAEKAAFISSGQIFAQAATRFHLDNGVYPNDTSPGQLPVGFGEYINYNKWLAPTPIGGQWDAELNEDGITSAVGVVFDGSNNKPDAFMLAIDAEIDDGDPETGFFRQFDDDGYFFVVAP